MVAAGVLWCLPAQAQRYPVTYRPPGVRYWVYESAHFRIIYEAGLDQEAGEAAAILEATLPEARRLVGLRRKLEMPVVLNRFNDRSNGYVTPFPFRQEVEAVPIRSQPLSPRPATWLWAVLPHELTHAVHAESGPGFGIGGVIRPFAPDLSRAVHFGAPAGFAEGAAVFLESTIRPGWGRLNHARFDMEFRAAMLSRRPWSLTQLLEPSSYSRPSDRHYYAGYLFPYMADRGRPEFFQKARDHFHRFPLAGFGLPLALATGELPARTSARMQRYYRERFEAEQEARGPFTEMDVLASGRGLVHRRPAWLDDRTLIAYVSGYDVRPGFYRIDAETGSRSRVSSQHVTDDVSHAFLPGRSALVFSRYVQDPVVDIQATAEVFRLDLKDGRTERLSHGGRLFGPVPAPGGGLWALRNQGPFNAWVHLSPEGRVEPVAAYARTYLVQLAPAPDGEAVAAIANVEGRQGLYLAGTAAQRPPVLEPVVVFEDASVFDLAWSPDGRHIVFAADRGKVSNLFALDVATREVVQLTNVPFGAIEPAVSPDGRFIAMVNYRHERYDLVRIPFDPGAGQPVPASLLLDDFAPLTPIADAEPTDTLLVAGRRPYRAFRHLAPRIVAPTLHYDAGTTEAPGLEPGAGVGITVQGVDPLETWAYGAELYRQRERWWGNVSLASGRFVLRPSVELYRRPSTVLLQAPGTSAGVVRVGREERGAALGVTLPLTLSSNVFRTQALFTLRGTYRQDRLFDERGETVRPLRDRITLRPAMVFGYRLQTNRRDLVPNSGLLLHTQGAFDAWADGSTPERWVRGDLSLFVPLLAGVNGGLRVATALLSQNEGGWTDLDAFVPRGYEGRYLGRGTFLRYGLEYVQPLSFIDDGALLVPVYLKVLYSYGFAERLSPAGRNEDGPAMASIGGGLGLQVRLFHLLDLDLRLGAAYRIKERDWKGVYR